MRSIPALYWFQVWDIYRLELILPFRNWNLSQNYTNKHAQKRIPVDSSPLQRGQQGRKSSIKTSTRIFDVSVQFTFFFFVAMGSSVFVWLSKNMLYRRMNFSVGFFASIGIYADWCIEYVQGRIEGIKSIHDDMVFWLSCLFGWHRVWFVCQSIKSAQRCAQRCESID